MKPHLSEEEISQLVAGQADREAEEHLRECAQCAAELKSTRTALLLFRDSGYRHAEYWERQPDVRTSFMPRRWVVAGLALAASIVASVVLASVVWLHKPEPQAVPKQEVFLQIPYVVPPAPYERTAVVRMDVPVAALIAAGFRMDASAANSVSADVMVGQDGRPLAVGFPENEQ